jgi:RNA polymerase sigma-70 factor (ECF subfamily)
MASVAEMVRGARAGSAESASALFEICWPIAWGTAFRVTGNHVLAEDAAQVAIQNFFRSLPRFDETRSVEPWVRRIAVNAALNELRRERGGQSVQTVAPETQAGLVSGGASPESDLIVGAVAALPRDQRLVVALHYWLDYTVADVAELLGVPVGTVASRLSRALDVLRTRLEEEHVC